jgi:hypothetical protein
LVAIVTVLTSFAPLLVDLGLGDATTQRSKITRSQVSSLFWLSSGIGVGSPSRCRPNRFLATGRTRDLPVPVQRASTHAKFFDHAGSSRRSRLRARLYSLPPSQRRQHPEYESLRGSMAGLCAPLPTPRCRLRRRPRTARGRCGSLLLHRIGLAPTTHCRSPGALQKILDTTQAEAGRAHRPPPAAP